ncbi:beta-galactosidase [Agrococcus jejuensis]|uniref:beta-galactosidase n=1 Tax=Agrococcus jejuensis TaxID=399736 RepID=UPI0011A21304|nr:beta-galactosidase [Agrococcus jejuensis]
MTHVQRWVRWPDGRARIGYGADYNPEQWDREVWREDVELMREAGVSIVTVGVFSWAMLQPEPERFDWDWLDEILDLLHQHGIAVDLATATASPPPWLTHLHPDVLPVDERGTVLSPGARQHWRPTSRIFREHALALVERMAERYGSHPALAAWHVSNELGCHNVHDYSDEAAAAFREWLGERYGDVATLNEAWSTTFWSQRYADLAEILPPRATTSFANPTQQLDFARFSSDALKDYLVAEREVLRRITPDVPITTNFMIMGETKAMDYADWASEVDFVSNDHYRHPGPQDLDELSFSANLTSGVAGGEPWYLMEHSPSAVNWQHVNVAKPAGELARDALTHLAHGADAIAYFQWRQSRGGAERHHSSMVPHAGRDSRIFREVVGLGEVLDRLADVAGAPRHAADVAILFDWQSWWAVDLDSQPSSLLRYKQEALDWYTALLDAGIRADVVPASAPLPGRGLVIVPMLHIVTDDLRDRLDAHVAAGGSVLVTAYAGIADERLHTELGGYPGRLRHLLGVRVDELLPVLGDETIHVDGSPATLWSERVEVAEGTEVLATFDDGPAAGGPAATLRAGAAGAGVAAYVATIPSTELRAALLARVLEAAGVESTLPESLRGRVELVERGEGGAWRFLVNRGVEPIAIDGDALGRVHVASDGSSDAVVPARGVLVLRADA